LDRRKFLMGMGAFAGAALVIPKAATIFDMGRDLMVTEGFGVSGFAPSQWIASSVMVSDGDGNEMVTPWITRQAYRQAMSYPLLPPPLCFDLSSSKLWAYDIDAFNWKPLAMV
jgi:hypothetical protein